MASNVANSEFKAARLALYDELAEVPKIAMIDAWRQVSMKWGASFPNVIKFVYVCLLFAVASVCWWSGALASIVLSKAGRVPSRITTLDSLLRMMLASPRHIATWQTQLGALSNTILGVTGTRATAGITGVCPPLLRDLWKNTAPGDLVLPDIEVDDLLTQCDMVDDEPWWADHSGACR